MKIMIITTPQELGGGETYVKNLVKGLPQHQFLILTSREFYQQLKSEGINSNLLLLSVKFLSRLHIVLFLILAPFSIIQYLFFILIFNPDVIHIQSREEQILVTSLARILGKKVIWTVHGSMEKGNRAVDFMLLRSSFYANKIIAVSNFVRDSLQSFGIKSKMLVIYHGVNLEKFIPESIQRNEKIIGYVGRLVDIKRPEIFLEASIKVLQKLPHAEAWIAGDGNLKTKMKNKVSNLTIKDRIKFLGYRQDINIIIRKFTILLVTSKTEGLDISVLEAIASGVPVVAVKVGALPEIIDRETGILIDSDDPEIIAGHVFSIIQNNKLLLEFRKSCREVAEKRFSLNRMLAETDLVYKI